MPRADRVFVASQTTKNAFIALGYPDSSMRVIPEGTDLPARLLRPNPRFRQQIGIVCRLVRAKGVQYTLRAAPEILREFPKVQFLIAGEGRYRRQLERLVRELNLESSVRFLGFVKDAWQIYSQIDLLVHATFDQGDSMPIAILEAAVAGVPAVTTRVGGIPEIVQHERTGILVPPRDSGEIASAVLRLLRDPALTVRLGEQAKDFVTRNFVMSQVARQILDQLAPEVASANAC
jgi:glycosyltransferase involved in cell wall biosynthesis